MRLSLLRNNIGLRLMHSKQASTYAGPRPDADRECAAQRRRPPLAFAFDIVRSCLTLLQLLCTADHSQDGVLVHGPSVLPEAKRALAILNGENKQRM